MSTPRHRIITVARGVAWGRATVRATVGRMPLSEVFTGPCNSAPVARTRRATVDSIACNSGRARATVVQQSNRISFSRCVQQSFCHPL
jgi:hypothetical protein